MSSRTSDANYELGFVNSLQFGVYSPEVIASKSVVNITVDSFYDSNGQPRINGLFDPRMGYIEPRLNCKTCDQTYINCPGHFGHIELPKPVFNLQFEDYIVKILRCICIKCSRLLLNKNHQLIKNIITTTKGSYKARFDKIFKLAQKIKTCGAVEKKTGELYDNGGCGAIQPSKYNGNNLRTDYIINADWKYDSGETPINLTQELNAEIVLAIFKRILEDDALVMGFSPKWCMPSWLIITILPVVPPSVRPSVRQYNNQRSEDDLTNKYYEIIKSCQDLRNKLAKNVNISPEQIKSYVNQVQHNVITLFNNDIKGIPPSLTRGGRPMKTLRQRLSGKEGRIRNNLMGKRVDFSARSVISPDANLSIDELGVPRKIAMNLTFPEVVNKYNINRLYQLVRNGNKIYPGARSIKNVNTGKQHAILDDIEHIGKHGVIETTPRDTSKIILNLGDTVNRHLINGDIVLFNRQPSLHKMSMMAHKVRVMEGNTFRLNVDVCKPYNADFDGDEMNLHIPQSLQTSVELKYLAAVSRHIISPSTNEPIIGPAQDNLLGLFKLTDDNVFFTQQEVMNLMVGVEKFNGTLPEPNVKNGGNSKNLLKWTGKQLYSMILPPITFYLKLSEKNPNLKDVIIENGILKHGQLEKKCSTSIVHYIFNDYGHKEASRYLNDLQRIVSRYLIRSGFSVGISDLIIDKEIRKRNEDIILQGKKDIIELTKKVHLNILADINDRHDILYDTMISAITTKTTDGIKNDIMKKLPLANRINYIVSSGSKGADINIQQMMCLLGQQSIDGKRVPMGFTDRTLPHYPRYENGAESRGFISSNFVNGLNPQEFFFHAMSGREGIIDTAVKTANSGYLQRRLVKSMEDLKVAHDFTVRASNNDIVQFCYGYDGFNSTDLEKQSTKFITIDLTTLNNNYYIDSTDTFEYVMKSEIDKMKKIDGWKNILLEYNKNLELLIEEFHKIYTKFSKANSIKLYYPINFARLIINTSKQFKLADANKSDIHPIEIINEITSLIKFCRINNRRSIACEILLWDNLSPKILLRDNKCNRVALMHIVNSIKARYQYSLAEGGDMVGPLAAQSLGERSTQMTLNSVDWETEIIIAKNGELIIPKIGEFIDNYYEECLADPKMASKIQYIKCPSKLDEDVSNHQIYIPLDDGNDWRAYSCDEDGNVIWTKLEAITRHPVVNKDGSETILEVELECGRTVKATKGRSFLVYDESTNKIIDKNGSDLQIDDLIPVCEGLELDLDNTTLSETSPETPYFKEITHLDVKKYLPPTEYIYRDEIDKALEVMTTENARGNRHWFKANQGSVFTVPYKRSDTFRDSICPKDKNGDIKEYPMNGIYSKLHIGCVYPLSMRSCISNIPANIPLDNSFGYFVGAYLADGMCNDLRIIISKEDKDFIAPIKELMASWNIGYRYVKSTKKEANLETGQTKWESNDHIFQSTLFANLLGKVFGKTSEDKQIPTWILQTPKGFLKGLISGYFSGDGCVSLDGSVSAASVGKQMIEMIGLILNRFNISWTIHKTKQDREKYPNAKEYIYNIRIPCEYNTNFSNHFIFTIKGKAERLLKYNNKDANKKKLFYEHFNKVILRKVKKITEVLPTEIEYKNIKKRWVYDLTVEKTRNFVNNTLINFVDTFHLAGVSEKSTVTQGVPRLTELLSNTKIPKNSSCEVYLDEEHRYNRDMAERVANNLELTTINDVLLSTAIYLEPDNDYSSVLVEDREFLEIYKIFSEMDPQAAHIPNNPWLIRLEFDRRKIIDKKVTMEDISLILKTNYPHAALMFMDDNASKLVFRMRLNFQSNPHKTRDDIEYIEKQIKEICDIVIKGIDDITYVQIPLDDSKMSSIIVKENGSFVEKKEYVLSTGGSNLFDILIREGVDSTRTYSVDPNEMYSVFGIEAARFQIQYQLNLVLLTSSIELSPRHLDLLCDKMCQNGDIMSVSRHGIKKENIGPLAKASFEETTDQLLEASLFGAIDNIKGVSSNIMVGQIPTCGTGDSTILIDEELLNTHLELIKEEEETENIDTYFKSSEYCNAGEIKFSLKDVDTNDGEYDDYPDIMVA